MNNRLIVMVGLPGSGKSTEAQKLEELYKSIYSNIKIFSSDSYRKELLGSEKDQSQNQLVFNKLYKDMGNFLNKENSLAIFDATNINLKSRKRIFEILPKSSKIEVIAQVVNTPYETCISRDSARKRSVGKQLIDKFYNNYQHPQKFEGFCEIFFTYPILKDILENYSFLNKSFYEELSLFNQNNPHHTKSLGEHCLSVANNYNKEDPRYLAGCYHDVGKLYTQTFDDKGIAHYYNHQNVGTYWLITHWLWWVPKNIKVENVQDILFYVNYHMHTHREFNSPKSKEKFKLIMGEDLFNKLIDFGEKDNEAK